MSRFSTVVMVCLAVVVPLLITTDAVAASSQVGSGFATVEPSASMAATNWKLASYKPPKKPPPKRSTGTGTR